jgi:hypothetical protein
MVGLSRFELLTPRLSSVCSNQLSYRPSYYYSRNAAKAFRRLKPRIFQYSPRAVKEPVGPILSKLDRRVHKQPSYYVPDRS